MVLFNMQYNFTIFANKINQISKHSVIHGLAFFFVREILGDILSIILSAKVLECFYVAIT